MPTSSSQSKTLTQSFLFLVTVTDPLDDIANDAHRDFLREYIDDWPYPPQVQYRVGQIINAELNGFPQKCEVQIVDSSLIQVLFQVRTCTSFFKLFLNGFLMSFSKYSKRITVVCVSSLERSKKGLDLPWLHTLGTHN